MFDKVIIEKGVWRAEVAPALGANITSLTCKGVNVFVPLKNEKQFEINPCLQGAPILMPANRTAGGRFVFGGREFSLPVNEPKTGAHLHGLVHRQAFTVEEHNDSLIRLGYENKGEIYPFPFIITAEYSIADNAFYQKYEILNTGKTDMPLTFALHTAFCEPDTFSVPIGLCQERNQRYIPTGRYIPLSPDEEKYVSGSESRGRVISGYYSLAGNTARIGDFQYTVSDEFDHWVLFNGGGESGFLCVEPQCGKVNGLNIKGGCRILSSGEKILFVTALERIILRKEVE